MTDSDSYKALSRLIESVGFAVMLSIWTVAMLAEVPHGSLGLLLVAIANVVRQLTWKWQDQSAHGVKA